MRFSHSDIKVLYYFLSVLIFNPPELFFVLSRAQWNTIYLYFVVAAGSSCFVILWYLRWVFSDLYYDYFHDIWWNRFEKRTLPLWVILREWRVFYPDFRGIANADGGNLSFSTLLYIYNYPKRINCYFFKLKTKFNGTLGNGYSLDFEIVLHSLKNNPLCTA